MMLRKGVLKGVYKRVYEKGSTIWMLKKRCTKRVYIKGCTKKGVPNGVYLKRVYRNGEYNP